MRKIPLCFYLQKFPLTDYSRDYGQNTNGDLRLSLGVLKPSDSGEVPKKKKYQIKQEETSDE